MRDQRSVVRKRVRETARNAFAQTREAMKQEADALETPHPLISRQLLCALKLLEKNEELFLDQIDTDYQFGLHDVEELWALLPPDRVLFRYDLECLTSAYERMYNSAGDDIIKLFNQGKQALDRMDYDIGLNILEQTLQRDPRNFLTLLTLSRGYLLYKENKSIALRMLERAGSNLPLQSTNHYKVLVLSLLAKAHEICGNHVNAVMTFKRLLYYGLDIPSTHYNIARNYALSDRRKEMFQTLDLQLKDHPEFLAYALIDPGFESARSELQQFIEEKSKAWRNNTSKVVESLNMLKTICDKHNLGQKDDEIRKHLGGLREMNMLADQDCLSAYVRIMQHQVINLVPAFPNRISRLLERGVEEKNEVIESFTRAHMEAEITRERGRIRKILVFTFFGLLSLLIILLLSGINAKIVFSITGILFMVEFLAVIYFETKPPNIERTQKTGSSALDKLQEDLRDVGNIKAKLSKSFEQFGGF